MINLFILFLLLIVIPACIDKSVLLDPDLIYSEDSQPSRLKDVIQQPLKNMTFAEATYAYKYYKRNGYTDMTIKAAQRMILVGGNPDIIKDVTLDLSEMFLEKKDYEKAIKYAIDYKNLYPGDKGCKKASYIEIMANFMLITNYECDHSNALKTIELSNQFLETYKDDKEYNSYINDMIEASYNILLQKEVHIIKSYISKYKHYQRLTSLTAAKRRVDYIRKNIAPFLKNSEIVANNIENEINDLLKID